MPRLPGHAAAGRAAAGEGRGDAGGAGPPQRELCQGAGPRDGRAARQGKGFGVWSVSGFGGLGGGGGRGVFFLADSFVSFFVFS